MKVSRAVDAVTDAKRIVSCPLRTTATSLAVCRADDAL
jgi:hypothetical protein